MADLEQLLVDAGAVRARLSNPREFRSAEEAARVVGQFIALEQQMQWLPDAPEQLKRHIVTPLERGVPNHAFMAGLVLARWSPDGTASALLNAARLPDTWCARMARLNLRWLAPTPENSHALTEVVERRPANHQIPRHVLAEALAHQRDPTVVPTIADYLSSGDDSANRSWTLISLAALQPDSGVTIAADLAREAAGTVGVTAIGISGAYGDGEALERLERVCRARSSDWHTALYWAGRIPHPDLAPVQIDGLNHPDGAVRADLVNSLFFVGSPETLRAASEALTDPDPAVIDTATSCMAQLLGPDFDDSDWEWDDDGRLNQTSRSLLKQKVKERIVQLTGGQRYLFGEPLHPHGLIDLMYTGFMPSHTWVNFIATTGAMVSYSPHMDALGNLESLHRLEEWFAAKGSAFVPGAWYYFGSRL